MARPWLAAWTRRPKSWTFVGETELVITTAVPACGGFSSQLASSPAEASSMKDRSGSIKAMIGRSAGM
ncbi:hypothetical protein AHiyo4_28820 [Arthrobacter sp. Hiyo4]|nr:hypothetical protein AHiyo4_28820 [Arthrobacter sp. Hiyo4]